MTWQIGGILAAVILLFGGGWYCGSLSSKAQVQQMQASSFKALADAYQDQQLAQQKKVAAYDQEISELKGSILTEYPNVPVRLCVATGASVPKGRDDGQKLPARTGVLPGASVQNSAGPDVGPEVFALADYADQIVATCREQ